MISFAAAALAASLLAAPARTTIYGDIITSYRQLEGGYFTSLDAEHFTFDQADLALNHQFSEWATGYARLTVGGSSSSLSEAYIRLLGLPWDGSITVGRFYKPLGAPIPLSNLSFAALAIHAYPELGLKLNFSRGIMDFELGIVNGNPISGPNQSARVGGSPILSNANPPNAVTEIDNDKDLYGRAALVFGEDWGSLTTGFTYTGGRLSRFETDFLNPGGNFNSGLFRFSQDFNTRRVHLAYDLDFQRGPFRCYGEIVHARDGRLMRHIRSGAVSWSFYPRVGTITATAGYDRLKTNAEYQIQIAPQTWNRERYSAVLTWWPKEFLSVSAEMDWNLEEIPQLAGHREGDMENDGFILQTILYF